MVKGLTTNHERFGELSALELVGQLSREEYLELRHHLESCAACRQEYLDFSAILSTQLPLLSQQLSFVDKEGDGISGSDAILVEIPKTSSAHPENLAGIPASNESRGLNRGQKLWPLLGRVPQLAAVVCLGLIIVVMFLSFGIHRFAMRERGLVATLSALNAEVARLRGQLVDNQPSPTRSVPANERDSRDGQTSQNFDLAMRDLEAQLKASKIELQLLKKELETTQGEKDEISSRVHEIQERLDKSGQELEAMTQERNQALGSLLGKQRELEALTLELSTAQESVERNRRLLAANRDIRDLMGARNLRIVDVFDVDGKGRTRRPFGRVFFTEGKSLIFYAFDLDREPSLRAAAFQGWGSRGPKGSAVQSLGIFYRDDQTTNRWFLKFDDPQVLSEIDSVFVTIEPAGGSRKPTGERLLPAYLKADLNHP